MLKQVLQLYFIKKKNVEASTCGYCLIIWFRHNLDYCVGQEADHKMLLVFLNLVRWLAYHATTMCNKFVL